MINAKLFRPGNLLSVVTVMGKQNDLLAANTDQKSFACEPAAKATIDWSAKATPRPVTRMINAFDYCLMMINDECSVVLAVA